MSNATELDLNLENLFQPAWAQGKTEANRYEKFTGQEGVRPERRGGDRPGGPGGPGARGPRRDGPGGGGGGGGRGGFGGFGGGDRGSRPGGPGGGAGRGGPRPGGGGRRDDRRGGDRQESERREAPVLAPLPELNVSFIPEDKGVEMLARQIKVTGRAYPLFQIALLILEKAERYTVQLGAKKKADGTVEKIFVCALDDSPWTNEEEAVAHALKTHFATFYQAERIATEPPKGTYTFVAQCGMSGVILGPPNYHDYQNQLHKLHADKFSRMPFDMFKARVKIVKDEAVVKQWVEEQSFKTEYQCLNVPEPLKLASMDEVVQHFRATHKDAIVKPVESLIVAGPASRTLLCSGLQRLIRQEWESQRHFPLPIATKLSQQFAHYGLQFFKVNKTVTHVSVARPTYLEVETSPVSDNIRRIVEFINLNTKCTRKKLVEALAPTPKAAPLIITPAAPAPVVETPAPVAEGETAAAQPAEPAKPAAPAQPEVTPEQAAIISDLHWLIHQGHVLEFANGHMETAKKPAPRPVKEPKPAKPAPAKAAKAEAATEAATETPVETAGETAAEAEVEVTIPAEAVASAPAETAPAAAPVAAPAAVAVTAEVTAPVVEPAPIAEAAPAVETVPSANPQA